MPFVGTGHLWLIGIILIIVLIIWGPGKLPDVGSGLGRAIREFRKASSETREEFAKATRHDAPAEPAAAATPSTPVAPAPGAAPVSPVAEPTPVGAGPAVSRPTEPHAGEGDPTAAS